MFRELLTVIGGDDQERVVIDALFFEDVYHLGDLRVGIVDAAVIQRGDGSNLLGRKEFGGRRTLRIALRVDPGQKTGGAFVEPAATEG